MVTQEQAGQMAQEAIQAYIDRCEPESLEDAANVLMKLASVAGIFMAGLVGKEDAVARLDGVSDFIDSLKVTAQVTERVVQ